MQSKLHSRRRVRPEEQDSRMEVPLRNALNAALIGILCKEAANSLNSPTAEPARAVESSHREIEHYHASRHHALETGHLLNVRMMELSNSFVVCEGEVVRQGVENLSRGLITCNGVREGDA